MVKKIEDTELYKLAKRLGILDQLTEVEENSLKKYLTENIEKVNM